MRRLMTKYWKVLAYLVGYAVLVVTGLDTLNAFYVSAGMAWLVVFILRNNDGSTVQDQDLSDSRGLHGPYSTYYHRH